MRVDVLETESLPEARPYFPGTPLSPSSPVTLPYPLVLSAKQKHDYFVPRESFNVLAMFQNPMMMMMVGAGVLVLFMPTMMVRVPCIQAKRIFSLSLSGSPNCAIVTNGHSPKQKNMDPEVMEEFKGQQAKMAGVHSALQSGDLASGYVGNEECSEDVIDMLTRFLGSLNCCLAGETSPRE